jgi:hypothetical protein
MFLSFIPKLYGAIKSYVVYFIGGFFSTKPKILETEMKVMEINFNLSEDDYFESSGTEISNSENESKEFNLEQAQAPEPEEQSLVEKWSNNQIKIIEAHMDIINSLQTTPEIKNVLIKHEKKAHIKYDKYLSLAKDPKNAKVLKQVFEKQEDMNRGHNNEFDSYDEN